MALGLHFVAARARERQAFAGYAGLRRPAVGPLGLQAEKGKEIGACALRGRPERGRRAAWSRRRELSLQR
eukprot:7045772-Pyramimonas_sp.AAC.1